MANKKGYVEPAGYFPPEIRKIFEGGKTANKPATNQKKAAKKPAATKKGK